MFVKYKKGTTEIIQQAKTYREAATYEFKKMLDDIELFEDWMAENISTADIVTVFYAEDEVDRARARQRVLAGFKTDVWSWAWDEVAKNWVKIDDNDV